MAETHWKKLTNPNYLGSWDIPKGQSFTLTIDRVIQEEIFNQTKNAKETCTVIHFKENVKPMVANKTNCKMVATIYNTPYIEQWSGKQITVQVEKVKAFGKLEEALRISKDKPKVAQEYVCSDCGIMVTENVAKYAQQQFGVITCADCGKKRKEQKQDDTN